MKYDTAHNFVTSDHHFGSWKLDSCPLRGPVFSHEEEKALIAKWNSVVKPTDLVFYVGDFCDSGEADMKEYRSRLNGNILLVKGNHDDLSDDVYKTAFQSVCEELVIEELGLAFRHCPYGVGETGFRQVYGHVHDEGGMFCPPDPRTSFCACVMRNGGYPIPLKDVLASFQES